MGVRVSPSAPIFNYIIWKKGIDLEHKINSISSTEKELEIIMTLDEVQPYIDDEYKHAQETVEIKGFRKGKVPFKLIKQYYGSKIEFDSINNAANDKLNEIIKDEKIEIVGQPVLKDADKKDNNYVFTIVLTTFPEFELKEYRGITVNEPVYRVKDEDIEHEVQHVLLNYAQTEAADEIVDDWFVAEFDITELDPTNNLPVLSAKKESDKVFLHNHNIPEDFRANFIGKKVGDSFDTMLPNKDGENKLSRITITKIDKVILPELTEETVKLVSNNKFDNEEDFKSEIGFQVQEEWNRRSRTAMENQIVDKLVSAHEFEVPQEAIENAANILADDLKQRYKELEKIDNKEYVKDLFPQAEKALRWRLIRDKVIDKEGITVEDYDIDEKVDEMSKMFGFERDQIMNFVKNNPELHTQILNKKVFDLVLDFAITSETDFEGNELKDNEEEA